MGGPFPVGQKGPYVIAAYLRAWRAQPPVRFVVYAHYRSGSFLLRELLSCHPQVTCDEELFLPFMRTRFSRVPWPEGWLRGHARGEVYGCILREAQLERAAPGLLQRLGWKVIYLRRHDLVRQAVSNLAAQARRQWHTEHFTPWQVRLDPAAVRREIARGERIYLAERAALRDLSSFEVSYEDDLLEGDHQALMDRLFAWLGLESAPVQARLVRTGQRSLRESILNWDELGLSI